MPMLLAESLKDKRYTGQHAQGTTAIAISGSHNGSRPRSCRSTSNYVSLTARTDFTTSVDNEWLCLQLLKEYGLLTANAQIATFGTQRVLVVERFDRTLSHDGKQLFRLVQDDFCQATWTSPPMIYENEGGPCLQQIFPFCNSRNRRSQTCTHSWPHNFCSGY
jgi:serine/threonine protein kinase HipA of HipAB toxin-antitoxin module